MVKNVRRQRIYREFFLKDEYLSRNFVKITVLGFEKAKRYSRFKNNINRPFFTDTAAILILPPGHPI